MKITIDYIGGLHSDNIENLNNVNKFMLLDDLKRYISYHTLDFTEEEK
jgi:hypothetical protein